MSNLFGKTILITGSSGFIGASLARRLLDEVSGVKVIGIDNMNDYYDVSIKRSLFTNRLLKMVARSSEVW